MDFARFHHATIADFRPCPTPRREPDFVSAARSAYWDEGDLVIRCSDHWGAVRSCFWLFDGARRFGRTTTGACAYAAFAARLALTHDGRIVTVGGPPAAPPRRRLRRVRPRAAWRPRRPGA